MSHDRDQDVTDQLRELGLVGTDCADPLGTAEEKPAPKPARKQKPKPNPAKAAKKAKPSKDEGLISVTLVDETKQAKPAAKTVKAVPAAAPADEGKQPPIRELLLLRAANVLHCGVVGDLAIVGVLRENGTRSIRMRFDFSHKRDARFEIRILPVDERGPGWVSSFHDRQSAVAIHLYDLKAESGEVVHLAA